VSWFRDVTLNGGSCVCSGREMPKRTLDQMLRGIERISVSITGHDGLLNTGTDRGYKPINSTINLLFQQMICPVFQQIIS
jgi:hypothetical protein